MSCEQRQCSILGGRGLVEVLGPLQLCAFAPSVHICAKYGHGDRTTIGDRDGARDRDQTGAGDGGKPAMCSLRTLSCRSSMDSKENWCLFRTVASSSRILSSTPLRVVAELSMLWMGKGHWQGLDLLPPSPSPSLPLESAALHQVQPKHTACLMATYPPGCPTPLGRALGREIIRA